MNRKARALALFCAVIDSFIDASNNAAEHVFFFLKHSLAEHETSFLKTRIDYALIQPIRSQKSTSTEAEDQHYQVRVSAIVRQQSNSGEVSRPPDQAAIEVVRS